MLPLEAIELDAFRQRYAGHTFWCGTWLGGCGRQLTTKLYVDRVCHFAHHADTEADVKRAPCSRRARDVTSADHLYVKAAAERLLAARRLAGEVACSEPGAAPAGSLVQLRLGDDIALTIHMNGAVPPDWDNLQAAHRVVVEAGVPIDRRTLERLSHVHRIRCESDGTSRRVLIGTQTSRGTEWFGPEECTLGPAGLITPALKHLPDQPVARPPTRPHAQPAEQPARITPEIRRLLLRMATARVSRDVLGMRALLKECDGLLGRRTPPPPAVREARDAAERWLAEQDGGIIRKTDTEATARAREKDRSGAKHAPARRRRHLADVELALSQERFGDARALLRVITAMSADLPLSRAEKDQVQAARARVKAAGELGLLQDQVARKKWLPRRCPTCKALPGQECYDKVPGGQPLRRFGGHDERLLPIVRQQNRKAAKATAPRGGTTTADLARRASQIPCPTCKAGAGEPCTVPGSHPSRVRRVQVR
ncbi:hypothetical protein [Streptomyces sp. NPDC127098]|uniref:zinc finger domain-containing protein n=1 Tax=Streptomyces sp. NPDC127098 TaxID=3347137 RepID=UPI00364746EA